MIRKTTILAVCLLSLVCTQVSGVSPRKQKGELASEISYSSGLYVTAGGKFTVWGEGFRAGDKVRLTPMDGAAGAEVILDGAAMSDRLKVTFLASFNSGKYHMELVRRNGVQELGYVKFTVVDKLPTTPRITAHRGHWNANGSAQISRTSLEKAQELGVFATEFDVWLTTDGKLVVHHDARTIEGVMIQDSSYDQVKSYIMNNGERIATLQELLELGKKCPDVKLAVEIKTHKNLELNHAVAAATVKAVDEAGMAGQVMYIAFSLDICKELARLRPGCNVAYINGDKRPAEIHAFGINGVNYPFQTIRKDPGLIREAHDLGMTINVRTVNTMADVIEMANMGVDYISTDCPVEGQKIVEHFRQ